MRFPPDQTDWVDPRGPDGGTLLAPCEQYQPIAYPGLRSGDESVARMLIDLINGTKTGEGEGEGGTVLQDPEQYPEQNSGTNFPYEPSRLGSDGSQDTLNPDARDEARGGPGT